MRCSGCEKAYLRNRLLGFGVNQQVRFVGFMEPEENHEVREPVNALKALYPWAVKENPSLADNPGGFDKERKFLDFTGVILIKRFPAGPKDPPDNQQNHIFFSSEAFLSSFFSFFTMSIPHMGHLPGLSAEIWHIGQT